MVDGEVVRKQIESLIEKMNKDKLDLMLLILHTAIDVSEKIDETN